MFENTFTRYLIENGWEEATSMNYKKVGSDFEIIFDTSNQIEVYQGNNNVGSFYLQELDDLIRVLEEIK